MENEGLSTRELVRKLFIDVPNYSSWKLVTDEFWNDYNMNKIVYDGHGYCIMSGNNRVDVWNPKYPATDIYKEERERFNSDIILNNESIYFIEFITLLNNKVGKESCKHNYDCMNSSINELENKYNIVVNTGETKQYFRTKGGFCDCEILMNSI